MLPELMVKIWDGDPAEYFTHMDMNRVEYNANILAQEVGVATVEFMEATRADQFRYDEANRLESLIQRVADAVGVSVSTEASWSHGRSISYIDFERWEAGLWTIYKALGGVGERIPAGRILANYHAILFPDMWRGSGPYFMDLTMPAVHLDTEAMVFVTHTADVDQRQAEYNATLRAVHNGDREVRLYCLNLRPRVGIPITMAIGGLQMHQEVNLTASGWSGSGPWTQDVTVPSEATEAVIGQWEGMTDSAVEQMASAILFVSKISGSTITVTAIGEKPTMDLNPMILYDIFSVE